jgi:hypothetical protein
MKPIKLAVLTFIALAGIVVPTPAQVVVFNSFGPGNTYNSGVVWAVTGASASGGYRGQAEFFTPGISGYLSSIQLATYRLGGSGLSNFYIAQDNGSGIPGTILESFTSVLNANGLLTLNSTAKPLLQAGTEYWLCDEPAAGNSDNGWYQNNQNYTNGFAFERSEWGWEAVTSHAPSSGVFRVSVTPVPEPSVTGLATLCVGGLLFLRLKKSVVVE